VNALLARRDRRIEPLRERANAALVGLIGDDDQRVRALVGYDLEAVLLASVSRRGRALLARRARRARTCR
jgi:hypothetical protein